LFSRGASDDGRVADSRSDCAILSESLQSTMDSPLLSRSQQAHCAGILQTRSLLASLPTDLQEHFLALGKWRRLAPRTALFHAGEERGVLLGIASGFVAFESAASEQPMTLVDVQSGPLWLGGQPLVDGSMRLITAVARSEVEVIVMPAGCLNRLIASDLRYYPLALAIAARMFWITVTALGDALIPDSRQRCIAALLRISGRRSGDDSPVMIPISHTDLSQLCNLSRQTSGDVLRSLEAEGMLTLGYRSVTLTAPARLRALLDAR
jgi:CRP-like cAMP-binding protein